MAVTIRMARHGSKKRPHYRIVVADSAARRDGRFLELVGTYDPRPNPPAVKLDRERIRHWRSHGASTSATVKNLLDRYLDGQDTIAPKPARKSAGPAVAQAPAPAAE